MNEQTEVKKCKNTLQLFCLLILCYAPFAFINLAIANSSSSQCLNKEYFSSGGSLRSFSFTTGILYIIIPLFVVLSLIINVCAKYGEIKVLQVVLCALNGGIAFFKPMIFLIFGYQYFVIAVRFCPLYLKIYFLLFAIANLF